MIMRFYRKLSVLMAGCLVLGSIQLTGITAQASQTGEDAITFAEPDTQGTVTGNDSELPDGDIPNEAPPGEETPGEDIPDEDENKVLDIFPDNMAIFSIEGAETFAAAELGAYGRWNNTPVELTDGKLVLSFSKAPPQYCQ